MLCSYFHLLNHAVFHSSTVVTIFTPFTLFLFQTERNNFPYERRVESKAYIPADAGDYYYTAAVWGGYLEDMYKLVK